MTPSAQPARSEDLASGAPNTTPGRRRKTCPTCGNPPPKAKKPRASTTDEDYAAGLMRLVNGYAARIATAGPAALADAVRVRAALDAIINAGVETCRGPAWSASWAEIAEAVGLSRSAVAERWAAFESPRRPGGQPSGLR